MLAIPTKGKDLLWFQCKVSNRFVGLSADSPLESYASRPAAVNRHGGNVLAVDCGPPRYDPPLMLTIICGDPTPFALICAISVGCDLEIVAPAVRVGHRTFAKVCR